MPEAAEEWTRTMDLIQEDRLDSQIHFVLRQNELAGFPASIQPLSKRLVSLSTFIPYSTTVLYDLI